MRGRAAPVRKSPLECRSRAKSAEIDCFYRGNKRSLSGKVPTEARLGGVVTGGRKDSAATQALLLTPIRG